MINLTKNGYYTVGEKIFYSKSLALIEATKTSRPITWDFSNAIFSTMKWDTGYCEDLRLVYRARARQLREKYDYLILSYSGGSDTWTALNSFIDEGVQVDELLVRWPFKATNGLFTASRNPESWNILSEWELNIKPDLDLITKKYPNIKITVYDWSDDINDELIEEDWASVNDHLNPGVFRKFSVASESERLMIEAGKSVAIIWGVDKPQLKIENGNLYLYFLDKLANTRCVDGVNNRNPELFYWTPDMPELVHAQARVAYEHFINNPAHLSLFDWNSGWDAGSMDRKRLYDNLIRSIVYPDWNPNKFQAHKGGSMVWDGNDTWMFTGLKSHRYYQSWEHGLKSIKAAVDAKFYQPSKSGRFEGWTGFTSPMYNLGPVYKLLDI